MVKVDEWRSLVEIVMIIFPLLITGFRQPGQTKHIKKQSGPRKTSYKWAIAPISRVISPQWNPFILGRL